MRVTMLGRSGAPLTEAMRYTKGTDDSSRVVCPTVVSLARICSVTPV